MPRALIGILAIIGVALLFVLGGTIMTGIQDWRTNDQTDIFKVETGAGITSTNVTLTKALWENDHQYVDSITSDIDGDQPSASSYTAATRKLVITNLAANASRNLTVVYDIEALSDYQGVDTFAKYSPTVFWAAVIVLPIIVLYAVIKGRS